MIDTNWKKQILYFTLARYWQNIGKLVQYIGNNW